MTIIITSKDKSQHNPTNYYVVFCGFIMSTLLQYLIIVDFPRNFADISEKHVENYCFIGIVLKKDSIRSSSVTAIRYQPRPSPV